MLPSKKSIRKMRTQPFPGWVLSFVKNADDYCGSLIMFSIKIIEHKKYLVGKGINADGKFLSVISKEGDILMLRYLTELVFISFLTTMIKTVEVSITHFVPIYYLGKKN